MKSCFAPAIVLYACAGVVVLCAQDASDPPDPLSAQPANAYVPLTLGQKYLFATERALGGPGLALVIVKASYDQAFNRPNQWGGNADSFAVRAASHFGRSFLRQNIAFGVRALDGEDPRYFASGHGTKWHRVKYAAGHMFAVRNDAGAWMPAYSLLVSDLATPFIANEWRPDRRSTGREFRSAGVGIGLAVGSNLFQEFWPDLRQKFRRPVDFSIGAVAGHP